MASTTSSPPPSVSSAGVFGLIVLAGSISAFGAFLFLRRRRRRVPVAPSQPYVLRSFEEGILCSPFPKKPSRGKSDSGLPSFHLPTLHSNPFRAPSRPHSNGEMSRDVVKTSPRRKGISSASSRRRSAMMSESYAGEAERNGLFGKVRGGRTQGDQWEMLSDETQAVGGERAWKPWEAGPTPLEEAEGSNSTASTTMESLEPSSFLPYLANSHSQSHLTLKSPDPPAYPLPPLPTLPSYIRSPQSMAGSPSSLTRTSSEKIQDGRFPGMSRESAMLESMAHHESWYSLDELAGIDSGFGGMGGGAGEISPPPRVATTNTMRVAEQGGQSWTPHSPSPTVSSSSFHSTHSPSPTTHRTSIISTSLESPRVSSISTRGQTSFDSESSNAPSCGSDGRPLVGMPRKKSSVGSLFKAFRPREGGEGQGFALPSLPFSLTRSQSTLPPPAQARDPFLCPSVAPRIPSLVMMDDLDLSQGMRAEDFDKLDGLSTWALSQSGLSLADRGGRGEEKENFGTFVFPSSTSITSSGGAGKEWDPRRRNEREEDWEDVPVQSVARRDSKSKREILAEHNF